MGADKCEILVMAEGQVITTEMAYKKVDEVSKSYNIQYLQSTSQEEFFKDCAPGGRYDSIKAIAFNGPPAVPKLNAEVISKLPKSVKVIGNKGAGYDKVDVMAALEHGIQVSHTPGAVDNATATVAMHLIVSSLRRFYRGEVLARRGLWDQGYGYAHDPEGKTVGIIGMGNIGRTLARRALGYDMKVIYYNRNPVDPAVLKESRLEGQVEYVSNIEDLIKQSDVISLHMPLTASTKGLFGKKYFELMKPSAVLVNTARGGVVDEKAMIQALKDKQIAGVGLDVFENEPVIPVELRENENIAILPHLGTATHESRGAMEVLVLDNILSGLEKGKVINLVAEQKGKF